ncbi:MAG: cyclic pyranopterin monophosphate synthase MoaC [Sphingobium sp.]|nr:cyclic pyranopterin monophosphate synthase MoaC [Sphingobium sp.]
MGDRLTHLNEQGEARMVDVSAKAETTRTAIATGRIDMSAPARAAIGTGTVPKGDVLAAARIAGIMAAKRTADLIPLCHPLPISSVDIDLTLDDMGVACRATVRTAARTGVEMEAMTAVSVALLTIYDMAKALDKAMTIKDILLLSKEGGKSGPWSRPTS